MIRFSLLASFTSVSIFACVIAIPVILIVAPAVVRVVVPIVVETVVRAVA